MKFNSQNESNENSLLSLYHQVRDRLRKDIASGRFKDGDTIPSEPELAREYGVSQGTVRKAILDMTRQGIFYRKQGKGTFLDIGDIGKTRQGKSQNFRFIEGPDLELVKVKNTFLKSWIIPAEGDVANYLKLRKPAKVICLERMGEMADQFLIYTISYLPQSLYRGMEKYTAEDFSRNSLWKMQQIYFGIKIETREEFISAVAAEDTLARILRIMPGSPILRIETRLTSFQGDIVEYRVSHCQAGHLKFYIRSKGV
jgi:GntR family transcriptional regulator